MDMRELVLNLLESEFNALDLITINDRLGLTSVDDLRELENTLNELIDEQIVYFTHKNKYILYSKCPDFRKGKLQVNKSGNGFLLLDDEEDIFINRKNMGFALDDDIVLVKILEEGNKKREGMVVKVLKRDLKNIVGVIKSDGTSIYFEPNDKIDITLTIDESSLKNCVEGEVVVVSIIDDLGKNRYIGKVSQHICHKDDANEDILTIAAKHDIFPEFPETAMKQAEELPNEVSGLDEEIELQNRVDLRDEMIFTIDGADTKDIDDAISLTEKDGYFNLKVSIADVSYYVPLGSALDDEALKRGNSSYLAYSVIPMLPHKLSNGICSLNPNVDRCALTCDMLIDYKGSVIESDVYPSIIRSRKKMTYTAVNHILEDSKTDEGYEEFADTLIEMQKLAHIIRNARTKRGASDFDIPEAKIICNDLGKPTDIKERERGEGERLIEDFMVIANETIANMFYSRVLPTIYRVHDYPRPEKIQSFIAFCRSIGLPVKGKFNEITNPKMFQKLLNQVKTDGPESRIVKSLAVRSMPKAFYSDENIGHFGLAVILPHSYCHFTSPIRRYADLIVHRLIRTFLIEGKTDDKTINYWTATLPTIAKQISAREVASVEAEREVDKMKMAEYMEDHIGEEFDAIVSGVTSFGLFVQLDNLIEGLISIDSLDGNNFNYFEDIQSLIDEATKKTYRIGTPLKVKCVGASKELSQIDFEEVRTKKLEPNENNKKKELKLK